MSTLKGKIKAIEAKTDEYETATNFEAKKQQYINGLSSIRKSLAALERTVQSMEFVVGVLTRVFDEKPPSSVDTARRKAQQVIDRDEDDYYELVEEGRVDQYEQKIQQAQSNVDQARQAVQDQLREKQNTWETRVQSARSVQKLVDGSADTRKTLNDIESFVTRRMWDDSNSISSLASEWNGLQKQWEKGGADWDTFQQQNNLSDDTLALLKDLAKGNQIKLRRVSEQNAEELLSVDELQNAIKISL